MTIRQSNIQSSNHRLSSIEKKSHARLEPSADCGMPPPPAVHLQRWAASWTSAASTCPRATPSYGISGTLRFRITSDGCKDNISQRGLGGKCLHGTIERFCHGRKRTNGMPPKEIHLWIKTSFRIMVLEVWSDNKEFLGLKRMLRTIVFMQSLRMGSLSSLSCT